MSNLMEIREMLANDLVAFGGYAQERADEYIQAIMQRVEHRIKINIMDRVTDLKSCGKNDDCWEFGDLIESYIEEWIND